jgi:hypothetical protein
LEDVEWASWAIEQGHAVAYVTEAEVIHVHEENPRAVYNRYRREAMALKQIRPQEHFHSGDLLRLVLSNILSDAWHALHERVLLQRIGEIVWFRWMQFWGTYRGFAHAGALTRQLKEAFYYPRGLARPRVSSGRNVEPIDYHALRPEREGRVRIRSGGQG